MDSCAQILGPYRYFVLTHSLELTLRTVLGPQNQGKSVTFHLLINTFLTVRCLTFVLLAAFSAQLSPLLRVLTLDLTLLYGQEPSMNSLYVATALNTLYFSVAMHRRSGRRFLAYIHTVTHAEVGGQETRSLFLYNQPRTLGHIRRRTRQWALVMQYFALVSALVWVLSQMWFTYRFAALLVHCLRGREPHWASLAYLVAFVLSSLANACFIGMFTFVHLNWSLLVALASWSLFAQLSQANRLLDLSTSTTVSDPRHGHGTLTPRRLGRFTRFHTCTLCTVFAYNRYGGRLLLAFLLCNLPVNGYFVVAGFVLRRLPPLTLAVCTNYALSQWIALVVFHLVAVMFSGRIHRCRWPLFRACARLAIGLTLQCSNSALVPSEVRPSRITGQMSVDSVTVGGETVGGGVVASNQALPPPPLPTSTSLSRRQAAISLQLPLRAQLRLALYVAKMNASNRYGITYGSIGLMSFRSFAQFAVVYFKIVIYWFKMIH